MCKKIRTNFPYVDAIISNINMFFYCPSRVQVFRFAITQKSVITRRGTRLFAAVYYTSNFEANIDSLPDENASSIRYVKVLLGKHNRRNDLSYIKSHFSCVPNLITSFGETKPNSCRCLGNCISSNISIKYSTGFEREIYHR